MGMQAFQGQGVVAACKMLLQIIGKAQKPKAGGQNVFDFVFQGRIGNVLLIWLNHKAMGPLRGLLFYVTNGCMDLESAFRLILYPKKRR